MKLGLRIERLILDGYDFNLHQRGQLQAAFEGELARLLTAGSLSDALSGGVALPALPPLRLAAGPETTPSQVGSSLARSVYGGLGR